MACSSIQSSSSSSQMRKKYDVFVSFRGTDTRNNFADHLFGALQRNGIVTFKDETMLEKGQSIAPELLHAIEGSQILIVIFSKNYASSAWCLRELAKVFDCILVPGKRVLPIFYDVDPSEVRKQSGSYKKAFAKHTRRFKQDLEKLEELKRWREALTHVSGLSGWDIRNKPQCVEIEKIVEEIKRILGHKFSSLPKDMVGMQSPLEELEKLLLGRPVDDVRVVGIYGMGGIGKTTLAKVLYDRISHQFDDCAFIDDLSKIHQYFGPIDVQTQLLGRTVQAQHLGQTVHGQLLGQTLNEENLQVCNHYNAANLIGRRLRHGKVLLVLDDIDRAEQPEELLGNVDRFGTGSRIIITSRNEQILKKCGVDVIYNVPLLDRDKSIQLFCRKAFKCDAIMKDSEKLTYDILQYANGLPLAIKVLASFLSDRDVFTWKRALAKLRDNQSKDVRNVLRLSFDGLEKMEKEIFLDIACFFNKHEEQYVKKVLNCCGLHADFGIRVLIDKSLISISYDYCLLDNRIEMHDLLEELGRKIIQENSTIEPRKWSRLWHHKYFYNVMLENTEENVEAIVLAWPILEGTEMLMTETLSKMSHLRLLILGAVNFSESVNCLSNELRYVEWYKYPFMYLPSKFQPNQLVELILEHSCIEQLWEGKKFLPSLRTLDFSHSKNLIKMPYFGDVPNLERLNLEGCVKLVQVDPSIGLLRKLIFLNLKDCKSLVSIPINMLGLSSLEYLNLSGCSKVSNSPMHVEHSEKLNTNEITLHSQSMSSIFKWITLLFQFLYPSAYDSSSASCLLPSLPSFSCLCELDFSFCDLSQIPDAIG